MSLNEILKISESVGINDQRFIGQMVSRNQKISTSEVMTVVPFGFELKPMQYLLYSRNRALLNSLRIPDKALPQYLNFGTTGWSNYIAYQGDMNEAQIVACKILPASSNANIILGNLPDMLETDYLVKAGDFIQMGLYSYIVTTDVFRGTSTTATIPVHRNIIAPITTELNAVIGEYGITVTMGGQNYIGITFQVILREYPTYTLVPFNNDSYIQWNGSFKAFEAVL